MSIFEHNIPIQIDPELEKKIKSFPAFGNFGQIKPVETTKPTSRPVNIPNTPNRSSDISRQVLQILTGVAAKGDTRNQDLYTGLSKIIQSSTILKKIYEYENTPELNAKVVLWGRLKGKMTLKDITGFPLIDFSPVKETQILAVFESKEKNTKIRIYDIKKNLENKEYINKLVGFRTPPKYDAGAIKFSPDGKNLACSIGTELFIYKDIFKDDKASKTIKTQVGKSVKKIDIMSWNKEGSLLACIDDRDIKIYSDKSETINLVYNFNTIPIDNEGQEPILEYNVKSLAWNPNGDLLAATYAILDNYKKISMYVVVIWTIKNDNIITPIASDVILCTIKNPLSNDRNIPIIWHPNGESMAIGQWGDIWKLNPQKQVVNQVTSINKNWIYSHSVFNNLFPYFENSTSTSVCMVWSPDGKYIARVCSIDNSSVDSFYVRVNINSVTNNKAFEKKFTFNNITETTEDNFPPQLKPILISQVTWSGDGELLALCDIKNNEILFIDMKAELSQSAGAGKYKYKGRSYKIHTGTKGGKYIVYGSEKKKIYIK